MINHKRPAGPSDVVVKIHRLNTASMTMHKAAHNQSDREMRVNTEGVFVAGGSHLPEVFGYTEAEVLGRTVDLLIPC
jgi:hypothetical protein